VGAAFGSSGANLTFKGAPDILLERRAASVAADYRLGPETTLSLGAGAGLGGVITADGGARYRLAPGWLVSFSYARRFLEGRGRAPFLLMGLSAAASGAGTSPERAGSRITSGAFYAIDVRAGLTVGKTFWNTLSPYAAVRAFGGPVFWGYKGATAFGTDKYHYQIALGMVTALPSQFDLYAEVAPLGERAVVIGAGRRF
jgi:hypothetical protein